jgi:homoserine kinase
LGLALSAYLNLPFPPRGEIDKIRVTGDLAQISTGEDNLIWQTALDVARDCGATLPAIELEIDNGIPLGKGMGSSAAALTAGVVIADRLLGLHWTPLLILNEAARLKVTRTMYGVRVGERWWQARSIPAAWRGRCGSSCRKTSWCPW